MPPGILQFIGMRYVSKGRRALVTGGKACSAVSRCISTGGYAAARAAKRAPLPAGGRMGRALPRHGLPAACRHASAPSRRIGAARHAGNPQRMGGRRRAAKAEAHRAVGFHRAHLHFPAGADGQLLSLRVSGIRAFPPACSRNAAANLCTGRAGRRCAHRRHDARAGRAGPGAKRRGRGGAAEPDRSGR